MSTINKYFIKILLSSLLVFLPFQILHCQSQLSIQVLSTNLEYSRTLNFPQSVEILEDCYNRVTNLESDALKIEYGYTLGRLYQKESIESQNTDPTLLLKGKRFYEDVLSVDRNQLPSRKNLVLLLQSAKMYDLALKHLDTLINEDYNLRNQYFYTKGDIYLEIEKQYPNEAILAFMDVLRVDPNNSNALNKISSIFNNSMKESEKESLYIKALDLKYLSSPTPSMRLLERYMEIILETYPERAEKALVAWADLLSSKSYISNTEFQNLPSLNPSFTQKWKNLEQIVRDPFAQTLSWWDTPRRAYIPNKIRLGLSNMAFSQGNVKSAYQLYIFIYNNTHPLDYIDIHGDYQMFRLRLDLIYYLTTLFLEFPEYNNQGLNLRRLEIELFNEKSESYEGDDLVGQFRMHYLLGNMYSDQNKWGSLTEPRCAIFQLDHAAKGHNKIVRNDPSFYRPLPEVYSKLGEGFSRQGDYKKAHVYYFEATKAFLDIDNLLLAKEYFQKSLKYWNKSELVKEMKEVEEILEIWDCINNSLIADLDAKLAKVDLEVLLNKSSKEPNFLIRQYFKIFSDVGHLKSQQGQPSYIDYSKALLLICKESVLTSSQDINRLRLINQSFFMNIYNKSQSNTYKILIPERTSERKIDSNVWTINLQGSEQKLAIELDPDFQIIAEIFLCLSKIDPTSIDIQFGFKINNGTLYIPQGSKMPPEINETKLLKIKGIKQIKSLSNN